MSSSNHHIIVPSDFDIEDAFSSTNSPNYLSVFLDYFLTIPRNNSPDSSNDFTKYLLDTLVFSPLHDDSYMEAMQAYNAISLPQVIIALPAVLLPSPVLSQSPISDSQDFFPSKEISPKDGKTLHFDKLRFAARHVAFCCKARCVLLQDSLRFASRYLAFCFKARCVLLQSSLRFASRHLAFCFNTLAFCIKILAICLMAALQQVKTMKIQAEIQVSRPRDLRRQLQLWKRFGRLHLIVIVLVRNIVILEAQATAMANADNPNRNPGPRETVTPLKWLATEYKSGSVLL
nr:hypothetical protein [Tanacetum cinerariifolium]